MSHLVSSNQILADIGLIGLAVMGENLILNMASKGFRVACWNRTVSKVKQFMRGRARGQSIVGCDTLEGFVACLNRPRIVMIMVRAGKAVDDTVNDLLKYVENGDIIIDGGNSNYVDTNRRIEWLKEKGIMFMGVGVSGGEEGALKGPSIMPGGTPEAWRHVQPIFQKIAAHVLDHGRPTPCCDYVGEGGSGHFVKMVHNGIEYGDMQLLAESYHLLKSYLGLNNDELAEVFSSWNAGEMESYLVEITAEIFRKKDDATGRHVIDLILDKAGQKGTGKWTIESALELSTPVTLVAEAVFARVLSSQKDLRLCADKAFSSTATATATAMTTTLSATERQRFIEDLHDAVYASKIVSYSQGFELLIRAAECYHWNLNYASIALMWRGGCIIRSRFLTKIAEAYGRQNNNNVTTTAADTRGSPVHLLLDPFFKSRIEAAHKGWRRVVTVAVNHGIAVPAISAALSYFDGLRNGRSPSNLIQAQRDYFGAHTFERIDQPRGKYFHTNWTGRGGDTSSSTYNL